MCSGDLPQTYQLNDGVASCPLEGGAAVLDVTEGRYFMLNGVASIIWTRLEQPATVDQLVELVAESFDSVSSSVEDDIRALLADLQERGFVKPGYA